MDYIKKMNGVIFGLSLCVRKDGPVVLIYPDGKKCQGYWVVQDNIPKIWFVLNHADVVQLFTPFVCKNLQ